MRNSKVRKWTVIYLINADPYLWDQARRMLDEILGLKISPAVAVIICLRAPIIALKEIDPDFKTSPKAKQSDTSTVFYSVEALNQLLNGKKSTLNPIGTDEDFNITSPKHIEKYFTNYIIDRYPASKYLLFTWGHGGSFGLFPRGDFLKAALGKRFEPKKWDMLSISDLETAITSSFGKRQGHKINLVIMMNCYMQLFDTGLSLSKTGVDYLVGPENFENAVGYNYYKIFKELFSHPEIKPADLAKLTVSSLKTKRYQNEAEKMNDSLGETAFFANDLRLYDRMAGLIDKVSDQLIEDLKIFSKEINDAVNACNELGGSNYSMRDYFRFMEQIRKIKGNGIGSDLFKKIEKLKRKIVLQKFYGDKVKIESPHGYPQGFAVNLPNSSEGGLTFYITYMTKNSPYASDFAKHYNWSLFVKQYLKIFGKKIPQHNKNSPSKTFHSF